MVDSDVLYELALLPAVLRTVEAADNDSLEVAGGLLWSDESPNNFQIFGNDDIQLCQLERIFNQCFKGPTNMCVRVLTVWEHPK